MNEARTDAPVLSNRRDDAARPMPRAQIKLTESYPVELNDGTTFMQPIAVRYGMVWAVGSTEAINFCRTEKRDAWCVCSAPTLENT